MSEQSPICYRPGRPRLLSVAVAAGLALSLSACSAAEDERALPAPEILVESLHSEDSIDGLEESLRPPGVCNPEVLESAAPTRQRAAAEDCVGAMERGRIALVVLGNPEDYAPLAANMEYALNRASGGIIQARVDPVYVSSEAVGSFIRALGSDECIDSVNGWLSVIADKTMDLDGYNGVIGATEYGRCNDGRTAVGEAFDGHVVLGEAFDWGRYSELYFVDTSVSARQLARIAMHGGHEVGHSVYGIKGHTGELIDLDADSDYISIIPGIPFDLRAYLQGMVYKEYASPKHTDIPDVMAGATGNLHATFNPIHLDSLARYRAVLDGEHVRLSTTASEQWGAFTADDARQNRFMRVDLSEPITVASLQEHDGDDGDAHGEALARSFTGLALVPRADEDGISDIRIYTTKGAHVALAPAVLPFSGAENTQAPYELVLGDGTSIFVQSSAGVLRMRQAQSSGTSGRCLADVSYAC